MLNHTYTSVNNANLVDCGKKQHISSQPSPLLKDNFLGEFRTELDKKKVLANLGIATDLVLEWGNIKGDIGDNLALSRELGVITSNISRIDEFYQLLVKDIDSLKTLIGGDQAAEALQNDRIQVLETAKQSIETEISTIKTHLSGTIEVSIEDIKSSIQNIDKQLANITSLITVSEAEGNALKLLKEDAPGLYVPDLSEQIRESNDKISVLETTVNQIPDTYVTKSELGGDGTFQFVNQSTFNSFSSDVSGRLDNVDGQIDNIDGQITEIQRDLSNTVKKGQNGHVAILQVEQLSKTDTNTDNTIKITNSLDPQGPFPLDVRFTIADSSQLKNLTAANCYAGMGVISVKESTLYILKEPAEGEVIDQEYLADTKNWKCPDDLVTQVKERTEFEELANSGQLQDHIFYYVYEDIDLVTGEKPTYEGDKDAYIEALEKWADDAVLRPQGYVSAQWGSEIEKQLGNKATTTSVSTLERKIVELEKEFSGNASDNNSTLGELQTQVNSNTETLGKANEAISTLTDDLNSFKQTVDNTYATIESLTTDDPNQKYIFTKQSEFNAYKERHQSELASEITTKTINTNSLNIAEVPVQVIDGVMCIGENSLAYDKDVPKIKIIANEADFENMVKEEGTYYYIEEASDRYVLSSELDTKLKQQTNSLATLSNLIVSTQTEIGSIRDLSTDNKSTLVSAINELEGKISNLAEAIRALQDQLN